MRSSGTIRAEIKALADEATTLVHSSQPTATIKAALDRIEPAVRTLHDELKDVEHIERQRGNVMHGGEVGGDAFAKSASPDRLRPDQSMAAWADRKALGRGGRPGEELSFDLMVRGLATGDWKGAEAEVKALNETTPSAGGYMVPTPLASYVIDLARNEARVFQAGATTVPMTTQTLRIARQISDPALAWHTEAATITPSNITFDSVTLTAQTLPVLIKVSLELFEDAPNANGVVSNAVAKALALELDRVALRGSGTPPEPKGIRNTSGVTVQSLGTNGAVPNGFGFLSTAIEAVRTANFEPNAVLYSPRTAGWLARQVDANGQPLRAPDEVAALAKLPTNQVPNTNTQGTATTASDAYVGQWDQLLIGIRTQFSIRPLTEKFIDTGEFGFFAYLRADVTLAHPAAFVVVEGILPGS